MPLTRRGNWALLLVLTALALAVLLIPVYLIRPFAPQTPGSLALSFTLRRWSPSVTLLAAVASLLLVWRIWRTRPRVLSRVTTVLILVLVLGSVWLARQNHFEWMFAPLPDARFVRAADAEFVAPDDMVLAVTKGADAVAYPVRQLAYHHLVEDAVGKVPIVATY
jgi:thiol:disulfide interchange protein